MSYSQQVGRFTVPAVAPGGQFYIPPAPGGQYGVPSQASNGQYVNLTKDDMDAARFLAENKKKGGRRTRLNRRRARKSRRRR